MKQILNLGVLSAFNVGLAFFFHWYLLTRLGPGVETDALFAGMTIPQLALAVINGSIIHVLVPILSGESIESRRRDSWFFFYLIGGAFGVLSLLLYLTAGVWVLWVIPGFDSAATELTIELTKIQLIGLLFYALVGVQTAACHAADRFVFAELVQLLVNLAALLALAYFLPRVGISAAAWIATSRALVHLVLLAPALGWPMRLAAGGSAAVAAWARIKPLIIGNAYFKSDLLVDRLLLSSATSGSISLFHLSQQIYQAAGQVINKSIAAPMVPALAIHFKAGDGFALQKLFLRRLFLAMTLGAAGLFLLITAGEDVLWLFLGGDGLDEGDVNRLWWIMIWLAGTFIGAIGGQICASTFYACGDTVTPTTMSVITFTIYIPLKIFAYYEWGVPGLAVLTSVYFMANFLIQIVLLKRNKIL
jgi:putative peptidoglycan lipid II flippase